MMRLVIKSAIACLLITGLAGCSTTGGMDELSADSIFKRHMAATYGKKDPNKLSMTVKSMLIVEDFGIEAEVTSKQMAPNFLLFEAELMGMSMSQGCNQELCWGQQPGQSINVLSGEELDLYRLQGDLTQWEHMDKYYDTLELIDPATMPDAKDYKIRAVNKHGRENFYYFSKETGLLSGTVITASSAMGVMTQTLNIAEYGNYDGVMLPKISTQASSMATSRTRSSASVGTRTTVSSPAP
jgi:hypothetical protein